MHAKGELATVHRQLCLNQELQDLIVQSNFATSLLAERSIPATQNIFIPLQNSNSISFSRSVSAVAHKGTTQINRNLGMEHE